MQIASAKRSDRPHDNYLADLIRYTPADESLVTGRPLTVEEAERIGFIKYAVPAPDLDRVVDEFAQELLAGAMRAIQWTKLSVMIVLTQLAHAALVASPAYKALSNVVSDHQVELYGPRATNSTPAPLGK